MEKTKTPLISLIIPIYNTEKFISRCLLSVCEQTLDYFELILVDDCTPDQSMRIAKDILSRYPNRLAQTIFISLKSNQGLPNARKLALDSANGKYIASIDSDDYMEKNSLELMLNKIEEENADILVCDYFFSSRTKDFYIKQECSDSPKEFIKKLLIAELQGFWWNKLYRKDILDKSTIFVDIHMQEDLLIAVQMALLSLKIAYLPKALVHYVQYNIHSMTKNYTQKSINDLLFVMDWLERELSKSPFYNNFIPYLSYRKYLMKFDIITYSSRKNRYSYFSLYNTEENNKLALSFINLPLYKKLFMYMVNKKCYIGVELILFFRKMKWFIFHKIN